MQPEQRIMGYFIEEAKEHLTTIEQGLLNLQGMLEDSEMLNEIFRAAHSIKGGAAMLGIDSIQQTAHGLEDYFKVLKEQPTKVDPKLESLFFQGFDILRDLLEHLQNSFSLSDQVAADAKNQAELVFAELKAHLTVLGRQNGAELPLQFEPFQAERATPKFPAPERTILSTFQNNVPAQLRAMLQLFKQADNLATRQELQNICQHLAQSGAQLQLSRWEVLAEVARLAIANSLNSYAVLAPVLIKDIKAASDLVLAGRAADIHPSQQLQALLSMPVTPALAPERFLIDEDEFLLQSIPEPNPEPEEAQSQQMGNTPLEPASFSLALPANDFEVETAAINDLADFFEGALPELETTWEVVVDDPDENKNGSIQGSDAELLSRGIEYPSGLETPPVASTDSGSAEFASFFDSEPGNEAPDEQQLEEFFAELTAPPSTGTWLELWESPSAAATSGDDSSSELLSDQSAAVTETELEQLFNSEEMIKSEGAGAEDFWLNQPPADSQSLEEFILADLTSTLPEGGLNPQDAEPQPADFLELSDEPAAIAHGVSQQNPSADLEVSEFSLAVPLAEEPDLGIPIISQAEMVGETSEETLSTESLFYTLAEIEDIDTASESTPTDSSEGELAFPNNSLETRKTEIESLVSDIEKLEQSEALDEDELTNLEVDPPDMKIELKTADTSDSYDRGSADDQEETEARDSEQDHLLPVELVDDLHQTGETTTSVDAVTDLWELETLLEEIPTIAAPTELSDETGDIPTKPPKVATSSSEPGLNDNFSELEALLAQPSPVPTQPPETTAQIRPNVEFGDLEKLLEDAEKGVGGTVKPASRSQIPPVRPQKSRRAGGNFVEQTMRVPVKHLDTMGNLVGELVVDRNSLEQNQERLHQSLDNLLYQVQRLTDSSQQMQDLYERSLLESSLVSTRPNAQSLSTHASTRADAMMGQASHATGTQFDALEMDRFTGFHTLSQEIIERIVRLREAASDIEFTVEETDQVTRMFRQATTQLQEGLTRSRMIPFSETADRLPRAVRDLALKCGKQANLRIEGRETLVDKGISERLYDPMTHLVNNTLAHGIELPEVRQALGKPPEGQITIKAFYQGNQTIISVSDDGAGIDPERVKAKAIEKALISADAAAKLSQIEVYNLLFHSGFSTKDEADGLAGRGVGMDVVRTSLDEIRGTITTESAVGRGTTFTIRLPLTLNITKALCCANNQGRIAFPLDGVEDVIDVLPENILTDDVEHPVIAWRNLHIPCHPLSKLLIPQRALGRNLGYTSKPDHSLVTVIVLRSQGNFIAVQVDQVLGEQEIVIKQLTGPVPKPTGVAGATVLGDGRVMPIADVLELMDLATGKLAVRGTLWHSNTPVEAPSSKTEPLVLIVDDSITVRELLSMTFKKVGYRVEQARDGQEAWEKLRAGLPCDLVLCDIEMPRMDGLELLSRVQQEPMLSDIPIAMLTSRGAERHRQMATQLGARGYFTKPYLEEALLDGAHRLLNGEVLVGKS